MSPKKNNSKVNPEFIRLPLVKRTDVEKIVSSNEIMAKLFVKPKAKFLELKPEVFTLLKSDPLVDAATREKMEQLIMFYQNPYYIERELLKLIFKKEYKSALSFWQKAEKDNQVMVDKNENVRFTFDSWYFVIYMRMKQPAKAGKYLESMQGADETEIFMDEVNFNNFIEPAIKRYFALEGLGSAGRPISKNSRLNEKAIINKIKKVIY